MMMKHHNNKYIKTQQDYQSVQHYKGTMLRFLLMGRLEQAKLTLWRDLNIILQMNVEGLSQEPSKISSNIFKAVMMDRYN